MKSWTVSVAGIMVAIGILGASAAPVPAHAATVLIDNFDAENGGQAKTGYAQFQNFSGRGNLREGSGIQTCSGLCVELVGQGPEFYGSRLDSNRIDLLFLAGDRVRVSFDLAGNGQAGSTPDKFSAGLFGTGLATQGGFNLGSGDQAYLGGGSYTAFSINIAPEAAFSRYSLFFTALTEGYLDGITFNNGDQKDPYGPLLDNLVVEVTSPVPEPATWSMMILGIALVGGMLRHRRRTRRGDHALNRLSGLRSL